MNLTYDPRFNVAYIRFREKSDAVETLKISEELLLDLAADGTLYGIELLNANEQLKGENGATLSVINEATGKKEEIGLDV